MEEDNTPLIREDIELKEVSNEVDEQVPNVGMVFDSEETLYLYFKKYAYQVGFGVRKGTCVKRKDGKAKYYTLTCAKGGKYAPKVGSDKRRLSTKTECKAKISVVANNSGKIIISRVSLEHNHPLSPRKSRFQRCHRNMDSYSKRRLQLNDYAGIPVNTIFHSLVVEAKGYDNLSFVERDCRNYIAKVRQLRLGVGDAEALHNYFVRMQKRNSYFFYIIDMDDEGRLRNVFWADARSRAAYESFGSVLSFDSTYLTNKYNMPFTPFVGVNHHGQSILFGCGLLSREDIETYVWLFKSWLDCMRGRSPKPIITDQDKAMRAAIAEVFPESHHRLCLWHIMKKIPEKLSGFAKYKEIKKTLKSIVYESLEHKEFDDGWYKMIADYGLEKNDWLSSLYEDRRQWVPIYVRAIFWAGMSTTQRSESMNSFFDGYVHSKTSLREFVEQYDHALRSKVEKENKADFESLNSSYQLITGLKFEKQFQEKYTNAIFKLFQDEIKGMLFCYFTLVKVEGVVSTFNVTDLVERKDGLPKRRVVYTLYYSEVECDIRCSCLLFEFHGILCRHMIKFLIEKDVEEIPSRYILTRWRKDIKHRPYFVENCYNDLKNNEQADGLCDHFFEVAQFANSKAKREFLKKLMDKAKERLTDNLCWIDNEQTSSVSDDIVLDSGGRLLSSKKVCSKGRPPIKRKESKVEKVGWSSTTMRETYFSGSSIPHAYVFGCVDNQALPTQYMKAHERTLQNPIFSQQSQV